MVYFITNDLSNPRSEHVYIALEKIFNEELVLLNNRGVIGANSLGRRCISTRENKSKPNMTWLFKVVFFISRTANSKNDINFPDRNLYSYRALRPIVNAIWKGKLFVNDILPKYNDLLFSSFRAKPVRIARVEPSPKDIFLADLLLFRNYELIRELKWLSSHCRLFSVVMSFDNPIYTQIMHKVENIFVWSGNMQNSLLHIHPYIKESQTTIVGSLLFSGNVVKSIRSKFVESTDNTVAYGCMFCDRLMLRYELELIKKIAATLMELGLTLIVRPYPSLDLSEYHSLLEINNIKLIRESTQVIDRETPDGKLFDESVKSKVQFLSSASWFLSMGTSFTIEAAICNMRILQIDLLSDEKWWMEIKKRLDISDHLDIYYSHYSRFDEKTILAECDDNFAMKNRILLEKLGITT